ncbi:MAG: Cathepsin L [Candidatus Aminicenantes bacterium]|nr:MAG: Cathepsin L [Candidatus Aminicenantes bacterium]
MKHYRILQVFIIFVLFFGLFQGVQVGQEAEKYYLEREREAPEKIKAQLQTLRDEIRDNNYTFQVGYTTAMDYTLEELTGLVEPANLLELMKEQNVAAEKLLDKKLEADIGATCSSTASSWDWRQNNGTTPVRDQKNCGSCWAFATHGAFESSYRIRNNVIINSSEQDTLDCNPWNYSCAGGWWAHQYLIDTGSATEAAYPYVAVKGPCQTKPRPYKAVAWGYVTSSSTIPSVVQLKQALCRYGPLSVAVYATNQFKGYTGGVFNACVTGNVNHGVTLIGWDDSKGANGAWLIENSWGPGWGSTGGFGTSKGYMWIEYNCNKIGYAAAWVQAALKPKNCD